MKYLEVTFHITDGSASAGQAPTRETSPHIAHKTDIARDILCEWVMPAGFEAFEQSEGGMKGYVQEELFDQQQLDDILAGWNFMGTSVAYEVEQMEDKNWNETWEDAGFEPNIVKGKVVIYDAKHAPETLPADTIHIGIEARQAFGTGTHETTRMAVNALLDLPLAGKRVLDCGCGTGVLGIAAAKLGAQAAVGYDIDEWSVENARHNAQLNQVENLEILHGDASVLSHISGLFDVVVANINRNILLADMGAFHEVMTADGHLILSGFYQSDIPMLQEHAQALGLEPCQQYADGDWACIVLAHS